VSAREPKARGASRPDGHPREPKNRGTARSAGREVTGGGRHRGAELAGTVHAGGSYDGKHRLPGALATAGQQHTGDSDTDEAGG
jgi:hypothetical protein